MTAVPTESASQHQLAHEPARRPAHHGTCDPADVPPGGRLAAAGGGRSLHVRLATWDDEPAVGGQGVYVSGLRRALTERGVTVTTVAGRGPEALSVRRITGRGHLDLSLALNCSPSLLTDGAPDVVHVSGGPGGLQVLRRLPVPVVYTAHHTHAQSSGWRALRRAAARVEAASYRRAVVVAAVSASTARALLSMGIDADRVVVVPPGIVPPARPPGSERDHRRILFVGRLTPEKGPMDAVAAMHQVAATVPGAHGVVVGSGPLARQVVAAAHAGGHVAVLGRIDDGGLAAEYWRAGVVLMPSRFEGLGMVALEAMAAGAVVVGYDVDGLRDAVGDCGVLVPAGDVSALARACRLLVSDPVRRDELAARGEETVRCQWSWARCAERMEELYRSALA